MLYPCSIEKYCSDEPIPLGSDRPAVQSGTWNQSSRVLAYKYSGFYHLVSLTLKIRELFKKEAQCRGYSITGGKTQNTLAPSLPPSNPQRCNWTVDYLEGSH